MVKESDEGKTVWAFPRWDNTKKSFFIVTGTLEYDMDDYGGLHPYVCDDKEEKHFIDEVGLFLSREEAIRQYQLEVELNIRKTKERIKNEQERIKNEQEWIKECEDKLEAIKKMEK